MELTQEKIQEVFSDEKFVESLLQMEEPEEVQAALKEKGIELTVEEVKQIREKLENTSEGELSEEDLGQVSGGIAITMIIGAIAGLISLTASAASYTHKQTRGRW